jgi:hypothetical protein
MFSTSDLTRIHEIKAMNYFVAGLLTAYIVWTLRFAIQFNTSDRYLYQKQKLLHNFLIWLVPFIWIMMLKTMASPTPGSSDKRRVRDKGAFSESGLTSWGDGSESASESSDTHTNG